MKGRYSHEHSAFAAEVTVSPALLSISLGFKYQFQVASDRPVKAKSLCHDDQLSATTFTAQSTGPLPLVLVVPTDIAEVLFNRAVPVYSEGCRFVWAF